MPKSPFPIRPILPTLAAPHGVGAGWRVNRLAEKACGDHVERRRAAVPLNYSSTPLRTTVLIVCQCRAVSSQKYTNYFSKLKTNSRRSQRIIFPTPTHHIVEEPLDGNEVERDLRLSEAHQPSRRVKQDGATDLLRVQANAFPSRGGARSRRVEVERGSFVGLRSSGDWEMM